MPKTIATTPSWYWPPGIPRVSGIPPFSLYELCVGRAARDCPDAPALISGNLRLTAKQFREEVDHWAAAIAASAGSQQRAVLVASPGASGAFLLFGALAAGLHVYVVAPGGDPAVAASRFGTSLVLDPNLPIDRNSFAPGQHRCPSLESLRAPAVAIDSPSGLVNHSNRSLLAAAISLITFLGATPARPWLATLPLSRWEGLASVIVPLYLGATLVLPPSGADPETIVQTIARERVGFAFDDLETAAHWTREAKQASKDARRVLEGFLLAVGGTFDPTERRRVSKSFESAALTVWGLPETGPVLASHQSWYVDDSIGIPITNAHVVPSEPRTGEPIQTPWELVESAEISVWSPALMAGYEGGDHPARWAGGRFRTGMIASSDANGMVYLLAMKRLAELRTAFAVI